MDNTGTSPSAFGRFLLTAAIRVAWATIRLGGRISALGERLEATVVRVAEKRSHDEADVLAPLMSAGAAK
jgi:hypothetical protein